MSDINAAGGPGAPRCAASAAETDHLTPLAEFPWSDGVVGMGFFPDELGLPFDWTWAANAIRP